MSQKSGKKLRRRLDDETETCVKIPIIEINNKPLEEENVGNGVVEEKKDNMGEVELNGTNDNESKSSNEPRELNTQNEVTYVEKIEVTVEEEEVKYESTSVIEISSTQTEDNQNKSKESQEVEVLETNCNQIEQVESKVELENEMEPLILETEEADPELEFDESDIDSQKSSPIRCTTRRSQTRNVPTPKTPKIFDSISEDKTSECSDKPSILTAPTPELTDTESEASVFKPVIDLHDVNEEVTYKANENLESFRNMSTKATVGSDTTRNAYLNSCADEEFELSPFLVQSREKSVGETLKLLSSRRSIKTARDYTLPISTKRAYKTLTSLSRKDPVDNIISTKRKNRSASPDFSKRFKTESPGLLSYFSSPLTNIKNRFTNKSEIPSSTPKLTAYKSKNLFDNTNMSKISLNETEDNPEKRWCAIM